MILKFIQAVNAVKKLLSQKATFYYLLLIAVLSELAYIIFVNTQKNTAILEYIIVYCFAFILFYAAFLLVRSKHELAGNKNILLLILISGLVFRATLIPSSPSTSDDVYRYIWEGKIIYNGHNPFDAPPNDVSLKYLHSEKLPALVTFKNMTAIYPPFAQLVFISGYILGGESDKGLKLIYLLCEFITLVFIIKILLLRKQNPNFIILYAWLPLPIMEYFINSHIDAVGITFFVIFIYYILQNKYFAASPFFAISILTKMFPAIVFPLIIKKIGLKKTFYFLIITLVIIFLFQYPFMPREGVLLESLSKYLRKWSFNGSLYKVLYFILHDGSTVRIILMVLFIISVGSISIKYNDFLKAVYAVWICFIIFSATIFPWYLGWIAAINPVFAFSSIISLFFTSNASNFTPMADGWQEFWWVSLIEYVPFYVLLIFESKKYLISTLKKYFIS